jgi:hypothetical protein
MAGKQKFAFPNEKTKGESVEPIKAVVEDTPPVVEDAPPSQETIMLSIQQKTAEVVELEAALKNAKAELQVLQYQLAAIPLPTEIDHIRHSKKITQMLQEKGVGHNPRPSYGGVGPDEARRRG